VTSKRDVRPREPVAYLLFLGPIYIEALQSHQPSEQSRAADNFK
jgi:hypothetical protein